MYPNTWTTGLITAIANITPRFCARPQRLAFFSGVMFCLAFSGPPLSHAVEATGETTPELMFHTPEEKKVFQYRTKRADKIALKLRKSANRYFSRLVHPAKKLRVNGRTSSGKKAYATVLATPPEMLNPAFETAAEPATLARYWVEGNDCIDASWGTYTRVPQTDANGNINYVMKLAGGVDSAYGCQIHTLNQDAARPIFIGGWLKGENITAINTTDSYGAYIGAYFVLKNGDVVECYNALPNTGTFPWRWVGFNSYSDCGITQPIVLAAVIPRLYNANGTAYVDNMQIVDKELASGAPAGQVTLVFDDSFKTDFSTALPILSAYNIPATSAVIAGHMENFPGSLTYDEAYSLIKAGWDIQSHSFTHPDFTKLLSTAANAEMVNSQTTIRNGLAMAAASHGEIFNPATQVTHLVWPYSALNAETVGWAQAHYQSGRTVYDGSNGYGTYPWVAYSWSMDSMTALNDIQARLDDACTNKRWLIFTAHRIGDPIVGEDNYYVNTAAYLTNVAQMIANKQATCPTPFRAVNYSTGMNNFGVSPSAKPAVP